MPRLRPVDVERATGKTRELLAAVQEELGMVPNLVRTMAHSPAVLEAYVSLTRTLAAGRLPATLREQIALTVAELNGCAYCLAVHSALGRMRGLGEEAIRDSRQGVSPDSTVEAALQFARRVVTERGRIDDQDVARLRRVGYGSGEIAELMGQVALSLFTNYFSQMAGTAVDFPLAPELSPPPAEPERR